MATKRCCVIPPPCVPCEEKACLISWAIYESILGFTFDGAFGDLNETDCGKSSCECRRQDNILVDEVGSTSPWNDWYTLYSCGTCLDCTNPGDPIDLPPCDQDLAGNINCPPGYPTYFSVQYQSRSGTRERIWYSKGVEVCVSARYVGETSIRFTAVVRYELAGATTISYATKRRWRKRVFECVSNKVIDPGTPSSDDSINIPQPLAPCENLLGDVGRYCDPYDPPDVPDPCEESTTITLSDICETLDIVAEECIYPEVSVQLVTFSARNCCDDGESCGAVGEIGTVSYESELYFCDELPATINLTAVGEPPASVRIQFPCIEGVSEPADIVFTIPGFLTLTVAC